MNVILISIDTWRFDCVGFQPDKRHLDRFRLLPLLETPTLDNLAENSLCFTNCFSTNTYTTSAHASVFTGYYPQIHGVRGFYDRVLNSSLLTVAELFKSKGYKTVMATDREELFTPLGLGRGFDHVFNFTDDSLQRYMEESRNQNNFYFVHFFDLHAPYLCSDSPPSDSYNNDFFSEMEKLYHKFNEHKTSERASALWHKLGRAIGYDSEILMPLYIKGVTKFDRGRLSSFISELDRSGYLEDSLIVAFSDHGEGRCAAVTKEFGHGGDLFDNVLRVPLMIYHPDIKHKQYDHLISIVDIFPTIISISGIESDYKTEGMSLGQGRESAYFETWRSSLIIPTEDHGNGVMQNQRSDTEFIIRQRGIRTENDKYVITGSYDSEQGSMLGLKDSWLLRQFGYNRYFPEMIKSFISKNITRRNTTKEMLVLTNNDFVRELYKKILCRFEDSDGFRLYSDRLNNGKISKEDLIMIFLNSEECRANPRYKVFDPETDPFEERPLKFTSFKQMDREVQKLFNQILALEKNSILTKRVWDSDYVFAENFCFPDKACIIEELKNLGYL